MRKLYQILYNVGRLTEGFSFPGGTLWQWGFPFWGTLWRGQVCEKGKHSELAKAVSPSRALPLLATPLFCVVKCDSVLAG